MRIHFVILIFTIVGCQIRPTIVKQEVTNHDYINAVLIDTRSAFEFTGFHISGSVNLNTIDFLILKNSRTDKRILDPDINQLIERLAKRGVSPLKKIVLLAEKKDSVENKKWRWLLGQLEIPDISMMSVRDFRTQNKDRVPQAPPEPVPIWEVKKYKNILAHADECFVNWSETSCSSAGF